MSPRIASIARFAGLAFVVWLVNFGLFIYFYRAITGELLSEYWKSQQVDYIFGTVLAGYAFGAFVIAAVATWLMRASGPRPGPGAPD